MTKFLQAPLVHLNGDTKETLSKQVEVSCSAAMAAFAQLHDCGPNQRNYYPRGDTAWENAVAEHRSRLERLDSVFKELAALHLAIEEGTTKAEMEE